MNFLKKIIPQKIKNIYHCAQAVLACLIYGFPSRKIKVIGVTGTNGKTTTVQMIGKILEEAGYKIAVISTINFKLGEKEWVNDTKYTTFSSFKIQKFIREAVKNSCDYFVLETSSHALDQYRVWGIKYDIAVITNVTREHLDYHKTMEEYRKAKSRLFKNVKTAIVNLDMEKSEEFLGCCAENIFGYSLKIPNSKFQIPNKSQCPNSKFQKVSAENIELGINNSKFRISHAYLPAGQAGRQTGNFKFQINLLGKFNIENALAAICVGLAEGIKMETIKNALEKIKGVSGRLENVSNAKELNIIIDYAVTPDSLSKLYALIQLINAKKKKIIAVFGSCGERDRGKRPIMGEIVARNADYAIVTNEDPYGEDPVQIINEVFSGVISPFRKGGMEGGFENLQENKNPSLTLPFKKGENKIKEDGVNAWKILDRREAIKKALRLARPGDFVIITGKGAEETMAVGNKRIPWNDKRIILEILRELD